MGIADAISWKSSKERYRRKSTSALAFCRTGDPATGEFGDAKLIRKFGDVPDDLSAL